GIVAVDAGDRMLDEGLARPITHAASLLVRHAGHLLEPFGDVAVTGEAIERQVGRVAVQTGAGLLALGHPPGLLLVEERIEMAPAVTIVEREGVAGEDALEPRIAVELLGGGATVAGSRSAAAVLGGGGQRGLQIAVVLVGP